MNTRAAARVAFTTVLLVFITWWLFRSVDLEQLLVTVGRSSWVLLLASIPVTLLSHLVRAQRWRRLLAGAPGRVQLRDSFASVMIGYAANTLIPRSGELLRPFVLTRRTSLAYSTTLSSVIVERILDVLTLLIGISILLVFRSDVVATALPDTEPSTIVLAFVAPLLALAIAVAVIAFTNVGPWFIATVVRRLHVGVAEKLGAILDDARQGASALSKSSAWPGVVLDSVLIWVLYAIPLWLVLLAIPWNGVPFGFDDAAILLVIVAIGVTIAPTPGALGVYQGFAQIALVRLYGATSTEGLAFGIVSWVMNYGVALLVGGIYLVLEMRHGLRWSDAAASETVEEAGESEAS